MNVYTLELARIPRTTLKVLMRLARTLLRDRPEATTAVIDKSVAHLMAVIEEVRSELVRRRLVKSATLNAPMVLFDYAVDGLWIALRMGLERERAFAHAGLELLPAELAQAGQLELLQARAKRAQQLWERLFGNEGTAFTKTKLFEQAESMATLISLIEHEQLRPQLEQIFSEAELALLYQCQKHYEDLVSARMSANAGPNLNQLRHKLSWAITAYVNAVHGLVDFDDPATHEVVLEALRPILTLRSLITRSVSGAALEQELEAFAEAGVPEDTENLGLEDSELGQDELDESAA